MNHLFGLKLVQMPDDTCKLIGIMVSSPKLKGPNAEPAAAVQTTMEAAPAVVAAPEPAGAVEAGSGGGAVAGSFCVRESIRVRVIDKRCAGGMLYNKKGVVVDVSSAARCARSDPSWRRPRNPSPHTMWHDMRHRLPWRGRGLRISGDFCQRSTMPAREAAS